MKTLADGSISTSNEKNVIEFHIKMCQKAKKNKFSCKQEPFNLRDLEKFILLIKKTSEFHRLSMEEEDTTYHSNDAIEKQCIRSSLKLIYGKRFDKEKDQTKVQEEIDLKFPTSNSLEGKLQQTLETELKEYTRIGHIFMKKGNASCPSQYHTTPFICQNLIDISASIHTGLPILLQGGNSSGKTTLVRHLSQICQRKLIIFPATKDTTTSDLIGSWTVNNNTAVLEKIRFLLKECAHQFLIFCLTDYHNGEVFKSLADFYSKFIRVFGNDHYDEAVSLKGAVSEFVDIVDKVISSKIELPFALIAGCEKLKMLVKMHGKKDVHFIFVEGPLLEAIRKGDWFLLDNVGQTPGDVLERLNSLLEAEPVLELCEGAKMETLSRENGKIHKDFRFIATNNTDRRSNVFSTAILNRCIVINLKRMDIKDEKEENDKTTTAFDIETTPAYDIMCQFFQHFENKETLSAILVQFHLKILELQKNKTISTVGNYRYNIRNLTNAAKLILNETKKQNVPTVKALTLSVEQCYCNACLLYTSPSPRDKRQSRMPSSA